MSLYGQLVKNGRVKWGALGGFGFALVFISVMETWATLIQATFRNVVVRPLEAAAHILELQNRAIFSGITDRLAGPAWSGAIGFVESLGPFAFLAAVGIVLLIGYVLVKEVELLG